MNRFRAGILTTLRLAICFACAVSGRLSLKAQPYVPGQSYFGRSNYIEYIAGNMPFILSAPHGGTLNPAELPDRTIGTFSTDTATDLLALDVRRAMTNRFHRQPHIIICHLDRQKIDCNREVIEGAQTNLLTGISWTNFQDFIAIAKDAVSNQFGRGLYIDLHGHGHDLQRLELGYLLTASQLTNSDATLNGSSSYANQSSIRELSQHSPATFAELLRGSNSLGGLLASNGYPSVPSPSIPDPGTNAYFNGGYNTAQHGSDGGGTISALQIECNYTNVRDSSLSRTLFASNLADALEVYFTQHVGLNLAQGPPTLAAISNRTLNSGQTLLITNVVSDTDTPPQTFTFTLTEFPTGAVVGASSGVVNWRPAVAQANSTNPITVRVTDNGTPNLSATQRFTVFVNPFNTPVVTKVMLTNTNRIRLTITGDAGPDYTLQVTTNLAGWTNLFTSNSPVLPFIWVDTNAASFQRRFYRIVPGP